MGLERVVHLPTDAAPDWTSVAGRLAERGEPAVLRMIDGLPAFPDEIPPDSWQELRVGLAGGMVTLRRKGRTIGVIVWGTADPGLLAARDRCCWALAAGTGGTVEADSGERLDADGFRSRFLG